MNTESYSLDAQLEKLGRAARNRRLELGLSQVELALMMNTSGPHINEIEHGRKNVQFSTLSRLADALGVKVRDLIDF